MSNDTKASCRFAASAWMTAIPMVVVVTCAETVRFAAGDPVVVVGWPPPPTSHQFYTAYLAAFVVGFVFAYTLSGTDEFNA